MSLEGISIRLQNALNALAPSNCATAVSSLGEADLIGLPNNAYDMIHSWAKHRQEEFKAGRRCASQALAKVGSEDRIALPDADGLPNWPQGFLGSISHSLGIAMAVAAKKEQYALVGLDLEKTNRLSESAARRVIHPLEVSFAGDNQVNASILFSLKEAFYKAQFPRWRELGNFRELALSVNLAEGTADIKEMDARFDSELVQLSFAFKIVDDFVISLAWT